MAGGRGSVPIQTGMATFSYVTTFFRFSFGRCELKDHSEQSTCGCLGRWDNKTEACYIKCGEMTTFSESGISKLNSNTKFSQL